MGMKGVTLAQLVNVSVGQTDVKRFEPHLVELQCVSRYALWAPSGTNHKAQLAISLSGRLCRYTNVEYLQSLYPKRRGQLLFQVFTLPFDRNDSVNKAIFILHSLCVFGAQMTIISAGLVYPLNIIST